MTTDPTPPKQTPASSLRPSVFWRLAEDIPAPLYRRLMLVSVVTPLVLWWLLTTFGQVDPKFLPAPGQVVTAAGRLGASGELWQDTWASLQRVGMGFGLSVLVAVPLGVLMGCFQSLRALGEPLFGLMRYMPAPAFIPLLILYLGIDEAPKIALIFIGTFFYNALMVMDTVKFVPKELIEATYMLGGNRFNTVVRVIFPHVLPGILDACRINFASAWQLVIVAELVAATEGLGRRISLAGRFLRTDEIFVGLIVIGLIGLGLDLLFQYLVRVTCRWAHPE
ncbi:MAG: ABC transporter permease [Gloeomargarita sp. GMQP_bins_120]